MRTKKTEQQVSYDEGSPGPGNSSESEFESSSRHQPPTSIAHGCREVPRGEIHVSKEVAEKSCYEGTHECGARYHQHSLQENR